MAAVAGAAPPAGLDTLAHARTESRARAASLALEVGHASLSRRFDAPRRVSGVLPTTQDGHNSAAGAGASTPLPRAEELVFQSLLVLGFDPVAAEEKFGVQFGPESVGRVCCAPWQQLVAQTARF
jgi:hypothetical protein